MTINDGVSQAIDEALRTAGLRAADGATSAVSVNDWEPAAVDSGDMGFAGGADGD